MEAVPPIRINACNTAPLNKKGAYVLYWMTAHRRLRDNFALQYAVECANAHGVGLLIFEPLRCGYPWASDRIHRFILDGMGDHATQLATHRAAYFPYAEQKEGDGKGLLKALAAHAVLIVADEYPCFFLPRMIKAAALSATVRMEEVDANGMLPLRAAQKTYTTAYSFRRGLHKMLRDHLVHLPESSPLEHLELAFGARDQLEQLQDRWPRASEDLLTHGALKPLQALPLDHSVAPVPMTGGSVAGEARMELFVEERLSAYPEDRNKPGVDGASNLSPYLHFGHVGTHTVFKEIVQRESWSMEQLSEKPTGQRSGWWNMSEGAEAFLDELITWRELGYNMSHREPHRYDDYTSLPEWAKTTLAQHADDPRPHTYTLEEFEQARTHDELWNAAQTQLVREGHIHNYLRMLWGKKILHWTQTPYEALEIMIELNNKYGIDGRDPNSYSGIFWTLGRYDRGWTEREIFGKVRYMTSESTRRKFKVKDYIKAYTPQAPHPR